MKWVVKSTISAETLALKDSLESCFMIKSLLVEWIGKDSYQNNIPVCCYIGNKSLVNKVNSTKTLTEKQLQVDVCVIGDDWETRIWNK